MLTASPFHESLTPIKFLESYITFIPSTLQTPLSQHWGSQPYYLAAGSTEHTAAIPISQTVKIKTSLLNTVTAASEQTHRSSDRHSFLDLATARMIISEYNALGVEHPLFCVLKGIFRLNRRVSGGIQERKCIPRRENYTAHAVRTSSCTCWTRQQALYGDRN